MKGSAGNLLREALGIPFNYKYSDEDIATLREMTTGVIPYFIAFTARSGSTFLTHQIHAAGVLSEPHEWFNWGYVKENAGKGEAAFSEYFSSILSAKRSRNGVFGCEINWLQFCALRSIVEPQMLFKNKVRWFYLRRRNVIAQAISNFIADRTGFFHSYQSSDAAMERVASLNYDSEAIKGYVKSFIEQEKSFDQWFLENNVVPVDVFYEDVVHDPCRVVMLFANVLGVRLPTDFARTTFENPIKKIGGEQNAEFERRFREEEADFVLEYFNSRGLILDHAKGL